MANKVKISELPVLPDDVSADNVNVVGVEIGGKTYQVPLGRVRIVVDAAVNANSVNPVQNKAIAAELNKKANLASPKLTGTPKAPTALLGTKTTQLATTAFVQNTAELMAPLVSPAFTGNPTAPTQSATDNSTKIATTAFVKNAIGNISVSGWGNCEALKPSISMIQNSDLGVDEGGMPEPMIKTKAFIGKEFILWRFNRGRRTKHPIEDNNEKPLFNEYPKMERLTEGNTPHPVLFVADDDGYIRLKERFEGIQAGTTLGHFIYANEMYVEYDKDYSLQYIRWRGQYKCRIIGVGGIRRLSKFHKSALFAISPADAKGGLVYMRYYLTMGRKGGFVSYIGNNLVGVKATTAVDFR